MFRAKHPNLPEAERIDAVAIETNGNEKTVRRELIKNVTNW